ncbi:very short patch repair protein [Deinococcus carri]|uniref:Very short patch repair protein n=2 Tax=Deinococcus carri TaxID=1211323 RepID=A0ABP9W702_9DEIO
MGRVRQRDTAPELALRSALHRRGLRFRKNVKGLPGSPDIVFIRAKVAVFVDGDFWHGRDFDGWKDKLQPFWRAKIERNIQRDAQNVANLEALGWRVLRVWEKDIKKRLDEVAAHVFDRVHEV